MASPEGPYRARIGERTFALTLQDGALTVEGAEADARLVPVSGSTYLLTLDGRTHRVTLTGREEDRLLLSLDGQRFEVEVHDAQRLMLERFGMSSATNAAPRELRAPMPGLVRAVAVQPGDVVEVGTRLVVLEAMKMENELRAAHTGKVAKVPVSPGDAVSKGAVLVEFE